MEVKYSVDDDKNNKSPISYQAVLEIQENLSLPTSNKGDSSVLSSMNSNKI
jgi:hypothetical protein